MQEELRRYLEDHRQEIGLSGEPKDWTIRKLAQGEYNINYLFEQDGKKLVLRLNTGSQMDLEDQIEYEYRALRALEQSGRTPKPLYVDGSKKELPYGFLIMEFIEGKVLDYRKDLLAAASCLADIHSMKIDPKDLIMPEDPKKAMIDECLAMFAKYENSSLCDDQKAVRIRKMLESGQKIASKKHESVKCCINTELNSGNFLVDGDLCRLVDWEKPLFGDPAQDLGHFLAPTTTLWKTEHILSREQIDGFIRSYVKAVDGRFDTQGIYERTMDYIKLNCLRGLTWCAMAWVEYQDPARPIQNEDTRKKLDFYTDHDFLDRIEQEYITIVEERKTDDIKLREQIDLLSKILKKNEKLYEVLEKLSEYGLEDYYVAGGCIVQTVWNRLCKKDIDHGIGDIDLVYFDPFDRSAEAENRVAEDILRYLGPCDLELDIKNQARVHLWYRSKFGSDLEPYSSLEQAIGTWETTTTAIGVRIEGGVLKVFAPYGLDDLFDMIFRANKVQVTQEIYEKKVEKWRSRWPEIQVIEW